MMFYDMVPFTIRNEVVCAIMWPHLKAQALRDTTPVFKTLTADSIVQMAEGDKRPTKAFKRYVSIQMKAHVTELRSTESSRGNRNFRIRLADEIEAWLNTDWTQANTQEEE